MSFCTCQISIEGCARHFGVDLGRREHPGPRRVEAIYLDMDGVLADFVRSAICSLARDPEEVMARIVPGDYDGIYQALQMTEDEFWWKMDATPGGAAPGSHLWEHMVPYPWRDRLYSICKKAAPTWILTSPSRSAGSSYGKVRWLQRWLGESFRNYVLTPRKWHLARPGTLLIDDSGRNVEKWREAGGAAILFPRIWNEDHALADLPMAQVERELASWISSEPS